MGIQDEKKRTNEERKQLSEQKKKTQAKFEGRIAAEENNPCLKEHQLSFKCLNDNNYSEDACKFYFENYKNCKSFWLSVQRERRNKKIYPALPPLEEREKIKAAHMNS